MTNYKAQGATYDKAIILADSGIRTNREEFYVGVTRAKKDISIYTDCIKSLTLSAGISQKKESVLDHIDQGKTESFYQRMVSYGEKLKTKIFEDAKKRVEKILEQKRTVQEKPVEKDIDNSSGMEYRV
jgi:hypothetical protein